MTTIHFGVNDIPYATALPTQEKRALRWRSGRKPWQRLPGTTTTGDVAEILEHRYGIFQHFYEKHGQDVIGPALEEAMRVKLENLLMGAPVDPDEATFQPGDLSPVEEAFRQFLDKREMDGVVPGVPTQAALRGVNHRLRHPYARSNPSRPSFIDTGTYQAQARVWVEG